MHKDEEDICIRTLDSVVLICEGKAFKLTSSVGFHTVREELAELDSTQEESDSRIVL